MTESTRKKIIFATLPLALAWAAYSLFGDKSTPVDSEPIAALQPDSTVVVRKSAGAPLDLEVRRNAPWGRDPFGLPQSAFSDAAATQPSPSESLAWVLAGIVYNHLQPMALINNRMVKIGDQIGDAKVVAIEKESVTLEQDGRRFKLTLGKG